MNYRTSIVMVSIAILLSIIIGSVGAVEITSIQKYDGSKTSVEVTTDAVKFSDYKSGIDIVTKLQVDGVEVSPSKDMDKQLVDQILFELSGGDKAPDVRFKYDYQETTIKETVTLDADHELSFPITVSEGFDLIRLDDGSYRIVNKDRTQFSGITIETPFGTDAKGNTIKMDYKLLEGNVLYLVYDHRDIQYPLTIDPTYTTSDTFVAPIGLFKVDLDMRGGGGAGSHSVTNGFTGNGGNPGSRTTQSNIAVIGGNSYPIVVGTGGAANEASGTSSTAFGYTASFGTGGTFPGADQNPHNGLDGGAPTGGTAGTAGQNGNFANGGAGGASSGGGGGGAGLDLGGVARNGGNGGNGVVVVTYTTVSASFTQNVTTGFYPGYVKMTDTSSGSPSSWTWQVRNATPGNNTWTTISTLQNPALTLGVGNWSIQVNSTGTYMYNTSTQVSWFNVTGLPVASFTQDKTIGNAPSTITLTDTSIGAPTTWYWGAKNLTPGNNTWFRFSTSQNPAQAFGYGNWSLNLTATNPVGSSISTQVSWFNVSIGPAISDFTITNPIVVSGATVTITPLGSDGNFYNTSWGDGAWSNATTNAAQTHTFTGPQIFSPSLYVFKTGAAVNSTTKSEAIGIDCMKYYPEVDGYVSRTTTAAFSTIRAGSGTSSDTTSTSMFTRLTAFSSGSTYSQLDRSILIFNMAGFPSGTLTITNASINLYGNAYSNTFSTAPNLTITGESGQNSISNIATSDYNKFSSVSLSSSNLTGAAYQVAAYNKIWLNAAGLAYMNKSGYTSYMVRTQWDTDNAPPTWGASQTGYFQPYAVQQGAGFKPYKIVNFSTSSIAWTSNTTIGMPGGYSTIIFNDTSPAYAGSSCWTFSDGTVSSLRNVSKTFAAAGVYSVSYMTPYPAGSWLNRTNYITISEPSFTCTPQYGSVPLTTTCTDTSVVASGNVLFTWGDGTANTNTVTSAAHTYTVGGYYSPQIQSPAGTGDFTTNSNYIGAGITGPVSSFTDNVTYSYIAVNAPVQFTDTSSGTPYAWSWNFGDGNTSTLQNPIKTWVTPGNYTVSLNVTNAAGYGISSQTVTVVTVPYAQFTASSTSGSPGLLVTFIDQSIPGVGATGLTYNWSFGDSLSAQPTSTTIGNVQHVYAYAGVYDVNLTITDSLGTSTMLKTQYITISTSQANTWYTPHQVSLHVLDKSENPLINVNVNATVDQSTLPGGLSGAAASLISNYGITQAAANSMVDSAIHQIGTTGSDGTITFTMHSSLQYTIVVTDSAGIQYTTKIYPLDSLYTIHTESGSSLAYTTQVATGIANVGNETLTFTEPNMSFMTMGLDLQFNDGKTRTCNFYVQEVDNRTAAYNYFIYNASWVGITNTRMLANTTVPNIRGQQFNWWWSCV